MVQTTDVRVAANGRMVLPRAMRDALGLRGESKVILTLEDNTVRLSPIGRGVRRAQDLYRQHVRNDRDTAAFLQERHDEADRGDGAASTKRGD